MTGWDLLPDGVAFAEAPIGVDPPPLYPEEEAAMVGAIVKRRREFATGRACARRALRELGVPEQAIPVGSGREPRWPPGVVGSISHCDTHCIAAAGPSSRFRGIGIDVERDRPLAAGVLPLVAGPGEVKWLASAGGGVAWDTLLFGIKESVHKAWFPATGEWLGFHDVVVALDPRAMAFRVELPCTAAGGAGASRTLHGRFAVRSGLLLSALVIPHPGPG